MARRMEPETAEEIALHVALDHTSTMTERSQPETIWARRIIRHLRRNGFDIVPRSTRKTSKAGAI